MLDKHRVLIATSPFGKTGRKPLDLLEATGWELIHNPYGRRLKVSEIPELIEDVDAVIAGTEPYTREILQEAKRLKVISRVGIGLDSVDLHACKEFGIAVTYTPDAPSQAVAELTVGNIINLSRYILSSDRSVRESAWNRFMGVLLKEMTIGIVGVGRIGKRVCKLLQPFNPKILACELEPDFGFGKKYGLKWVSKNELFRHSDLVSLHIPYNDHNHHYVDRNTISMMKTGSYLINTSRGGVVDEEALTDALLQKHLGGAALDVFEKEPYEGVLTQLDNVILTAHMGASAQASRFLMETGAAEDCIRALNGEKPEHDAIMETFEN
ncbi:MAG: phosphoglycerate dehydrogenase [bacterium]